MDEQDTLSKTTGQLIADLARQGSADTLTLDGVTYLFTPAGSTAHDISRVIEKMRPVPNRACGTTRMRSLDSFISLVKEWSGKTATTRVYANPDHPEFTAILNDNTATDAHWRDYRITYKAEHTPEWGRWLANNKKHMSQAEFGEFIEEHAADIADAATLLEVAGTLQAKTDIEFKSSKRLDNGQVQLTYNESIDSRAGADGSLQIPKEFALGIRIYKQGAGYKLRARLKYRLAQGAVKLWYELDRPELALEDAAREMVDKIRTAGLPVYMGDA